MTAISSAGGISQPSTRTWIHPAALVAAIGQLFTTSHADVQTETERQCCAGRGRRSATPAITNPASAGRERFRL